MLNVYTLILKTIAQCFVLYLVINNINYCLTNTNISRFNSFFIFIIYTLSTAFFYIYKPHLYDIISFIMLIIINMGVFKESLKLAFISSMITSALFNTSTRIISDISYLFNNEIENSLLCAIIASLLFVIISIPILKYIRNNANKISIVLQEMTIPLFVNIVIHTILIRTLLFANLELLIKLVFVLCESITSLSFIYYFVETKYTKMHTDIVANNMNNTIDKLRVIKHDFDNILLCISGYLATKQYDDLNSYIQELTNETKDINCDTELNQELIHYPALFGVLSAKYHIALSKKIDFNIKIDTDLNFISFNMANLSRIVGILLDNAIEASEKASLKKISVNIGKDISNDSTYIQIENSVKDKNIDIENIFEKGVSSKKIKSGIGLWEVKKLVDSAPNSHIFTNIKDNIFSQTLVIDNT